MAKPPPSTPHSDIDGVHEDERPNHQVADELGQDAGDLARAKEGSVARPPYTDEGSGGDDRTG